MLLKLRTEKKKTYAIGKLTYFFILYLIRNWYMLSALHTSSGTESKIIWTDEGNVRRTYSVTLDLCIWKMETWSRKIKLGIDSDILQFRFGAEHLLSQLWYVCDAGISWNSNSDTQRKIERESKRLKATRVTSCSFPVGINVKSVHCSPCSLC